MSWIWHILQNFFLFSYKSCTPIQIIWILNMPWSMFPNFLFSWEVVDTVGDGVWLGDVWVSLFASLYEAKIFVPPWCLPWCFALSCNQRGGSKKKPCMATWGSMSHSDLFLVVSGIGSYPQKASDTSCKIFWECRGKQIEISPWKFLLYFSS